MSFCIYLHANDIQYVHPLYAFLKISIRFKVIHICNIFYPSRYQHFLSSVPTGIKYQRTYEIIYVRIKYVILFVRFSCMRYSLSFDNHITSVSDIFNVAVQSFLMLLFNHYPNIWVHKRFQIIHHSYNIEDIKCLQIHIVG